MFDRKNAPSKNKIFDKLTKNISFEKLTRSPSPTTESFDSKLTASVNLHKKKNNTKQAVKSHNSPNDKLIPIKLTPIPQLSPASSNNSDSKELKNNAFEVVFDNSNNDKLHSSQQNLHPLDEPFILRNGKKIFPNNPTPKPDDTLSISKDDAFKLLQDLVKVAYSNLLKFWQMDLHFNITISENQTMKVHIPSVVFAIIGIKLLLTVFQPSKPETFNVLSPQAPKGSSFGIVPFFVIFLVILYWYKTSSTNEIKTEKVKSPVKEFTDPFPHTSNVNELFINDDNQALNESISSTDTNNIWDSETNNEFESDATPPLTRKNSLTTKMETMINKNKHSAPKNFHPVHRYEERKKVPKVKLHLNVPDEYKRHNQSPTTKHANNSFEELSRLRREEMLKGFYN